MARWRHCKGSCLPFANILAIRFGSSCAPIAALPVILIMAWCEDNAVFYCFGLARNDRLGEQLKSNFEGLRVQDKRS